MRPVTTAIHLASWALFIALILLVQSLSAQTTGQNVLQKKNSTAGFSLEAFTLSNGQLIGRTSGGTLSGITLGSGLTLSGTTLSSSASGGTWGSITGTLSSQTDLNTALGLKAPLASPTFTGTVTIPSGASISGYLTTAAAASTYALIGHTQAISTITGLQASLDAKAAAEIVTGVAQVVEIGVTAGEASNIQSAYITLDTGTETAVVWINAGGFGSAPVVSGTLYEVAVAIDASDSTVATAVAAEVDAITGLNASTVANVITVTSSSTGTRSAPSASSVLFTANETTAGVDAVNRLEATSGEFLTALNASEITTGTLSIARIADASLTNAKLANSSITINGTPISLGGSVTISASPGGSSGQVQYNNAGAFGGVTGLTLSSGTITRLTAATGTLTSSAPLFSGTQTWNAGAQAFHAFDINITSTNGSTHATGSTLQRWMIGGSPILSIASNTTTGNDASNWRLVFGSHASLGWAAAHGALTLRNAANSSEVNLRCSGLSLTMFAYVSNVVAAGSAGGEGDASLSGAGWRGAGLRMRNTGTITWTTGSDTTSAAAAIIDIGTGSPESVVTAPVGSLFLRTDGGAGTTLYVKESGTGNTGWVAK